MTTNFPTSVDAFTNPTSNDTLDNPPHDQQHADINDAMEAVQTSLLDGSPLRIDDANNRVGVNDATPSYTLDVNGDINTIGDLRIGGTAIGEWTSYTPTFGNVTGSVVSAKYALVNNVCHVSTTIQITAISNYFYLTLPFDCVNSYDLYSGNVFFFDVGSNIYFGHTLYFGSKDVRFSPLYSAGSYASYSTANASIPFTWASGDYLSFYLTYEVA